MFHRRHTGEDPFIRVRLGFLLFGAALGVVGMFTDTPWLIFTAMGTLLAGLLLKMIPSESDEE